MRSVMPTIQGLPYILDVVQSGAANAVNAINQSEITDSTTATGISFSTPNADVVVNHGRGRQLTGWLVIDRNANANIWKSASNNPAPESTIILQADAAVTASFLFF